MRSFNPAGIAKPASKYAQGVLHGPGQRLVVSGQVGIKPDGTIEAGMEAQMRRCWSNLLAVLADGGFTAKHLVKITVFVTLPGQTALYRAIRDEVLEGHLCAATYLQVAGLASPDFLVELEGEAVKD